MSEIVKASDVRKLAVLGAGTMGHGIAQVAALAGLEVVLRDMTDDLVRGGIEQIRANLDKGVARDKLTESQRNEALEHIRGATDLAEAVSDADVVIEAAPETMEIKQQIFRELDRAAPARALLATNTSSLSVLAVGAVVQNPARVVGMHFFNPVHIMKLVEVVHHEANPPAVVQAARELGERLGKTPVVVRDVPGFASSRLGLAIGLEAMRMVEQNVATPQDIDTAMKLGYGFPMGPLELTDLVGLDVRLAIADYLTQELGPRFEPPSLLRRMVAEGKLGKKSGAGFYNWTDESRKE